MAFCSDLDQHQTSEALDLAAIQIASPYEVLVKNGGQKREAESLSVHWRMNRLAGKNCFSVLRDQPG